LVALCLATFMLLLDITIVQAALPTIQRRLNGDLTGLQWTIDAYTLPLAALIITLGTVADRYGRRSVFLAGLGVFSGASLACGLAQSMAALDAFRAVQGAGGAAMFATTLALIGQEFDGAARGRAVLVWGSTVGAAVACGPLLGGVLTEYASWRWIFLVNLPLGAVTAVMTLRHISDARDETGRRLDPAGLATLTAALGLLVGGLLRGSATDWTSPAAEGCIIAGGVLGVAFVLLQRRPGAMLDRGLLGNRSFGGVSVATVALGGGMFGAILYLTIYLQGVLGLSPVAAGLRLLSVTLPIFLVPMVLRRAQISAVSGPLIGTGLAVIATGLVTMTWATAGSSWLRLLPGLLLAGIGIGLANAAVAATALAVVPPNRAGLASGVSNTCRLGGIALGIAVLGALFRAGVTAALPAGHRPGVAALVATGHLQAAAQQLGADGVGHAQSAFTVGLRVLLLAAALIVLSGSAVAFRYVHPGEGSVRTPTPPPFPGWSTAVSTDAATVEELGDAVPASSARTAAARAR
jgi:EmrB/QacA subfamily drug resistance transporter